MKNNAAIWKGIGDESTQDNALVRALKLGLDVHYRQVTVAMQEDGGRIKGAGKMSHGALLNWVRRKLEEGWRISSGAHLGAGTEPSPDPIPSSDDEGSESSRSSGQRVAVCSRHRSWGPIVGG